MKWLRRIPWLRVLITTGVMWAGLAGRGERAAPREPTSIERRLATDIQFTATQGTPLIVALRQFSEKSRIPIHVDWHSLESAGIASDAPLNFIDSTGPARQV